MAVMTLPSGNAAEHSKQFNELRSSFWEQVQEQLPKLIGRGKHGVQTGDPHGTSASAMAHLPRGCCTRALCLC